MDHVRSALSLPPQWLESYNRFITTNRTSVTQIESALRSLTYIIPYHSLSSTSISASANTIPTPTSSDILSESLHSSIQLLSLYHDSLLFRSLSKLPGMPSVQSRDPHNRYTAFWTQKSASYRRVARLLAVVRYTQLLWEMAAKRKGERIRWRVVVVLELAKAICRLLLIQITGLRGVVTPLLPERENDEIPEEGRSGVEAQFSHPNKSTIENQRQRTDRSYQMKRTGLTLPALPQGNDISSYLLTKTLLAEDIRSPTFLLPRLNGSFSVQAAEYLHILVPVIYVLALARSRNNMYNWQPWLIGLSLELVARQLRNEKETGPRWGVRGTQLEREEWAKRAWAMGWWLVRGAFYENVTKGMLYSVRERMPGLIRGVMDDYLWLWDGYYFSTSAD